MDFQIIPASKHRGLWPLVLVMSVLFCICFSCSSDDDNNDDSDYSDPVLPNVLTLGGEFYDAGYALINTSDGNYLIAGDSNDDIIGFFTDGYIIKVDQSGNRIWDKRVPDDLFTDVIETRNSQYLVLINQGSLLALDVNGNDEWCQHFSQAYQLVMNTQSMKETWDGFIITGTYYPVSMSNRDILLLKTDFYGNEVWRKNFGNESPEYAYDVEVTHDGGFLIVGSTYPDEASYYDDIYLIRTDKDGTLLWTQTHGGLSYDCGYDLLPTSDGGYLVVGNSGVTYPGGSRASAMKIDGNGEIEWSGLFGEGNQTAALSAQSSENGGFIVSGYTRVSEEQNYNSRLDVFLFALNSEGYLLWSQNLNLHTIITSDFDKAYDMVAIGNDEYVVTGTMGEYWQNEYERYGDMFLMKIDFEGNILSFD